MSCAECSLPEALCVCTTTGPAVELPTEVVPLPAEKTSRTFEEAVDLSSFRRIAGLDESERQGDFLALARLLGGQAESLLKAVQKNQKGDALKSLMLAAVTIKKIALAYALDPVADAAETLADELDKASRSS